MKGVSGCGPLSDFVCHPHHGLSGGQSVYSVVPQ